LDSEEEFLFAMMTLHKVEHFGERKLFELAPRVIKMKEKGGISHKSLNMLANEGSITPRCGESQILDWHNKSRTEYDTWKNDGIEVTTAFSSDYPHMLKEIKNHPFFLYYKGDIHPLAKKNIAIVGTREPSDTGRRKAEKIAYELVMKDVGIVSGLATGCDTAGHEGALNGGGYTCAVLAHGLDIVSPAKNRDLAKKILENGGALISEYKPEVPAFKRHYMMRNRIQSALSSHVIVIETTKTGGTMHTARFAGEYNRNIGVIEFAEGESTPDYVTGFEEICTELHGRVLRNMKDINQFIFDD